MGLKKRFGNTLCIPVKSEVYQLILTEADKRDITMAELVRQVIDKWINVKDQVK